MSVEIVPDRISNVDYGIGLLKGIVRVVESHPNREQGALAPLLKQAAVALGLNRIGNKESREAILKKWSSEIGMEVYLEGSDDN